MKLILSGSTGWIGRAVLAGCLADSRVTSVLALSRRPLPDETSKHPKLKVIIVKDFLSYSEELLDELKGADGCIWSLGASSGDTVLEVDYPMAFAKAYAKTIVSEGSAGNKKPFRFLFLGGMFAETDQNRTLYFLPNARRAKGLGLARSLEFETSPENPAGKHASGTGQWESFGVRPGYVCPTGGNIASYLLGKNLAIPQDVLARTMVDIVLDRSASGWPKEKVMAHSQIVQHAAENAKA